MNTLNLTILRKRLYEYHKCECVSGSGSNPIDTEHFPINNAESPDDEDSETKLNDPDLTAYLKRSNGNTEEDIKVLDPEETDDTMDASSTKDLIKGMLFTVLIL